MNEEELDERFSLDYDGVSADAERPEMMTMIQTLAAEIKILKKRVKTLDGSNDKSDLDDEEQDGYPAWKPGTANERFWVKYAATAQ